jgi:hypothetical protein
MRTTSTLVGLTLLALAASARAEEAEPAAVAPAAVAPAAAAPAAAADSAASTTPPPAAELASPAPAVAPPQGETAAATDQPAVSRRKFQLGLAFLPMALGGFTSEPVGQPVTNDAAFAYGFSLSAGYEVLSGLLVGLAPQLTFNVKDKLSSITGKQLDAMVRIAYYYRPADTISIYAEALPGYSLLLLPDGATAKGFVLAFGLGCAMDLTERFFANLGVGYQIGFQNLLQETTDQTGEAYSNTLQTRTRYLRFALGGGVRF